MKVKFAQKHVLWICFFIAIANLFILLLPLIVPGTAVYEATLGKLFFLIIPRLSISVLGMDKWDFSPSSFDGFSYSINNLMLVFYLLLLIAVLLSAITRNRESRLLNFFVSFLCYGSIF